MAPCPSVLSTASLSLYPWDKCLIPQGVKGKINHPGEIGEPADLAGKRQREIGYLTDWLGPPLRVENACLAITNGQHLGWCLLSRHLGKIAAL
jgi:hypothetical protein